MKIKKPNPTPGWDWPQLLGDKCFNWSATSPALHNVPSPPFNPEPPPSLQWAWRTSHPRERASEAHCVFQLWTVLELWCAFVVVFSRAVKGRLVVELRVSTNEDLGVLPPCRCMGNVPAPCKVPSRAKLPVTVPTHEPSIPSAVRLNGNQNCFFFGVSFRGGLCKTCYHLLSGSGWPTRCFRVSWGTAPDENNSITLTNLGYIYIYIFSVWNEWQAMSVLTILFCLSFFVFTGFFYKCDVSFGLIITVVPGEVCHPTCQFQQRCNTNGILSNHVCRVLSPPMA